MKVASLALLTTVGVLSQATPAPKPAVPFDPIAASSQGPLMSQGAADQRCPPDFWLCADSNPLSARSDVLVFQTPPLPSDIDGSPDCEALGRV
jgi:hypothetical protein